MQPDELERLLVSIGLKRVRMSGNNIRACCPVHMESNPSWGISVIAPHKHGCFACGYKGTLYDLLIKIGNYSDPQARRICKIADQDKALPSLVSYKQSSSIIDAEEMYPFVFTPTAARYLASRGVYPAVAARLGCVHHKQDRRVLFPWKWNGKLVGVTGRAIDNNPARVLPYFGTQKGQFLYLPSGRIARNESLILVEGEIDALKVYCSGHRNVAALSFGTFTDTQAEKVLAASPCSIISFTDDDAAGDKLFHIIERKLGSSVRLLRVEYPDDLREAYDEVGVKLDPGAMHLPVLDRLIKNSAHLAFPSF